MQWNCKGNKIIIKYMYS